ncbi:MAG: 4-(cytidine 5'-diphospho)-2-C-methyl-D-erythritol kinase [Lachnospiraceae bacterium]|nr:4-(cytidine 5'-diphospho)-2-C-methyl-D-erythritol kinase [Lachnospiraceae bacterium]
MEQLTRNAYGKINLGLDVLGVLPNGYHQVKMIMQTVDLHDEVTVTLVDATGITMDVTLEESSAVLEADENNLCVKAAKCLLSDANRTDVGVHISLIKRIPIAAGMAGGSTDAAAVFCGLNELLQLGYSQEELMKLAVTIGADVPYCIMGGTALSEGIGEELTKLSDAPAWTVLIGKPPIDVSTKYVYEHLDMAQNVIHPDIDGLQQALADGDLDRSADLMGNVLAQVTEPAYPVITEIKELMKQEGARVAMMTGSGPTVFGIFSKEAEARQAEAVLRASGLCQQVHVTRLTKGEGARE